MGTLKLKSYLIFAITLFTLFSATAQNPLKGKSNTYELSLLTEGLGTLTPFTMRDNFGFYWGSSVFGMHSFDGHSRIIYNNNFQEDNFEVSTQGTGYREFSIENGSILYAVENSRVGAIQVIDLSTRTVIDRLEPNAPLSIRYITALGSEVYGLHQYEGSSKWFIQNLTTRGDEVELNVHGNANRFFSHGGCFWIDTENTLYRCSKSFSILDTWKGEVEFSNIPLLYNYEDTNEIRIWDDSSNGFQRFNLPENILKRESRYHIVDDEVWISSFNLDLKLFNRDTRKTEDYTPLITKLIKEESPENISGTLSILGDIKQNNEDRIILISIDNLLLVLHKSKKQRQNFREDCISEEKITSMRALVLDEFDNLYASFYTNIKVKLKNDTTFRYFDLLKNKYIDSRSTYSLSYINGHLIWNNTHFNLETGEENIFIDDSYGGHYNHALVKDTLWVLSWFSNKLYRYHPSSKDLKPISRKEIGREVISDMEHEPDTDQFWISTQTDGIWVIDKEGNMLKQYSPAQLGQHNQYKYTFELMFKDNKLYYGTMQGLGCIHLETDSIEFFRTNYRKSDQDISQMLVYSILENEEGNFYLGTDRGIVLFNPITKRYSRLKRGHPLENVEFNRNSRLKDRQGKYYFGSTDGLYSFYPQELLFEENTPISPPFLTEVKAYNSKEKRMNSLNLDIEGKDEIRFNSNHSNIAIRYSSPVLDDEVFYSYRIQGYQQEWSLNRNEGKLELNILPPGKYVIELKATTKNYSDEGFIRRINIYMPHKWYRIWWVQALLFICTLALTSLLIRYRYLNLIHQQQRLVELRTKISEDLHDDVGSVLAGLAMQAEVLELNAKEENKPALIRISNMSRSAMSKMRDMVWAMDAEKDTLESLVDRMREFGEQTLRLKEIMFTINVENLGFEQVIPGNIRQNLYLIFKEAIANSARHSNATKVEVILKNQADTFEMSIRDNGSTPKKSYKTTGQGRRNMKMRAERIGATLEIHQNDGFVVLLTMEAL